MCQDLVKTRRGNKLQGSVSDLFSGRVWTGRQAQEIGLVDGIGDVEGIVKKKFGDKVRSGHEKALILGLG